MQLVTRAEWGARPPKQRQRGTLQGVTTVHWEGPTLRVAGQLTWDHSRCAALVRGIQAFHMDGRGWSDIAYNFVECPHGYTFEGRGFNVINAANGTNTGNRTSHTVCCLAGVDNPFTDAERAGLRGAIRGIHEAVGAPDAARPHSDWHSTDCPGDARRAWVRGGMPGDGVAAPPIPAPPASSPGRARWHTPASVTRPDGARAAAAASPTRASRASPACSPP